MSAMRTRLSAVILFWVVIALVTLHYPLSTELLAHADYESSEPAADAVLSQSPTQVQVWFTQELFRREGENSLEVYGPGDLRVDLDDAAIDDDDRNLMTVSLQSDLADGDYTVRWRTLSADDGDDAEGEFQFTLRSNTPTPETDQPAPTSTPQPSTPQPSTPQPSTPQPSESESEPSPTAGSALAETEEAPTGERSPGTGLPCLGISFPVALLLGAFMLRRGRGKKML